MDESITYKRNAENVCPRFEKGTIYDLGMTS